ncbi:MAG: diguanylate cyclase [Burkholderiales bacterium]
MKRPEASIMAALLLLALALAAALGPRVAHAAPLVLTDAERQWLREHPVIRYATDPNAPPFSIVTDAGHEGFDADLLAELGQMLGVRFEFRPGIAWPEVEPFVARGDVDIVSSLAPTPEREKLMRFTRPILALDTGLFTRIDAPFYGSLADLKGMRVGVSRGIVLFQRLRQDYPEIVLVPVASGVDGVVALSLGDIDALASAIATVSYTVRAQDIDNLRMQFTIPYVAKLAFGVRADWPELAVILDKGLDALGEEGLSRIMRNRMDVPGPEYSRDQLLGALGAFALATFLVIATILVVKNRRISAALGRTRQLEQELREVAVTDALTGLGNRRSFDLSLADEVRRALRYGDDLSLMFCDLDHFKRINDAHGHARGDRVLVEFAAAVRATLRDTDSAFRYGGEEFVALLPRTNSTDALQIAERTRQTVAERKPGETDVTVSIGVASMAQLPHKTPEALFAAADKMLYAAKAAGRNCVRAYENPPSPPAPRLDENRLE